MNKDDFSCNDMIKQGVLTFLQGNYMYIYMYLYLYMYVYVYTELWAIFLLFATKCSADTSKLLVAINTEPNTLTTDEKHSMYVTK